LDKSHLFSENVLELLDCVLISSWFSSFLLNFFS
jgi:hypothetical protein